MAIISCIIHRLHNHINEGMFFFSFHLATWMCRQEARRETYVCRFLYYRYDLQANTVYESEKERENEIRGLCVMTAYPYLQAHAHAWVRQRKKKKKKCRQNKFIFAINTISHTLHMHEDERKELYGFFFSSFFLVALSFVRCVLTEGSWFVCINVLMVWAIFAHKICDNIFTFTFPSLALSPVRFMAHIHIQMPCGTAVYLRKPMIPTGPEWFHFHTQRAREQKYEI